MFTIENTAYRKVIFIGLAVFCLTPWVSSPSALALGFFAALWIGNPYLEKTHKSIHLLLQISIVGLGFGLNLDEALQAGKSGFLITVLSICSVLLLGWLIGKAMKMERPLSYLISVGTAICGGSAIAAIAPIIKSSAKQVSVALAIIFTLNSLALFIFPVVGTWLGMSQEQFGLWCAIGIHDTSSVVGAAAKFGDEALKVATTVKLARALWIIPLSLITIFWFKSNATKIRIPWFIGFFVLAILASTYIPMLAPFSGGITFVAKSGLHLTLFLIGTTLSLQSLKSIGTNPLLLALALWFFVSMGSFFLIKEYYFFFI